MCFHSYADDTQLYISTEPHQIEAIETITSCLASVNKWMNSNFLKLNENKTEILVVGSRINREKILRNLGELGSRVKPEVTSLGVILDSDLNFNAQKKDHQNCHFFISGIFPKSGHF